MTREEAIWYLTPIAESASLERYKESLSMAISALREQEERRWIPVTDKLPEPPKVVTNADRIRDMSDEELAWELMTWRCEAVARHHGIESQYPDTQQTILSWLQQPMRSTLTRDGRHAMEE